LTENTGLVGAFRPYSQVTRREGIQITLSTEHSILTNLLAQAAGQGTPQYSYSPIKYFRAIEVAPIQKRADDLARRFRELDSRIQALNWSVDLIE